MNDDVFKRVLRYFNNELENFLISDLKKLVDIKPNESGYGGCAFPLAILVFSAIDLLGFLTREELEGQKIIKSNTSKNIRWYIEYYFDNRYKIYIDLLVDIFRHGISHQLFPKAAGVVKSSSEDFSIFRDNNGMWILDSNKFANDFLKSLKLLKKIIEKRSNKNLIKIINDRLDNLAKEDYQILNYINKQYEKINRNSNNKIL